MSLTVYFLSHELRVQWRSWRSRAFVALYLIICTAPAAVVFLHQRQTSAQLGAATYAAEVLTVLPAASAVLAFVLAAEAILRERESGMWLALTMMPMSSAAYLLRRFLALALVVVAVSLVPLALATALAAAAGVPAAAWSNLAGPWMLEVLPITVAAAALSLGTCTIANGMVTGTVQALTTVLLAAALLNRLLAPSAHHLGTPASWLGVDRLVARADLYVQAVRGRVPPAVAATEGGFDAAAAAEQWMTPASLILAAAFAALGAAPSFLRRSQRDLQPWRVSAAHPLRGMIGLANRLRVRYVPDAWPAATDRLVCWAGIAALAAALAIFWWRDGVVRGEATLRYAAETTGWPAPTSPDIRPTRWTLTGRLSPDGEVAARITAGLRNAGSLPENRVAFSLNPFLRVDGLGASRGDARAEQRWDRLEVRMAPPLAAGEERFLMLTLAGRPAEARFELPAPLLSFFARWDYQLSHRVSHELADISTSYRARAISPRRIALDASDLLPVPRFTSWTLKPPGSAAARVPEEELLRDLDLTIEVTAPPGIFLADSCGDSSGAGRTLRSRCRTVLDDFVIRGARAAPIAAEGPVLAVLPQHLAIGPTYSSSLRSMAAALPRAWPGLGSIAHPVLLEWSPEPDLDPRHGMSPWWGKDGTDQEASLEAHGALLLVPESMVVRSAALAPNRLLVELVSSALLRRRTLAEDQRFVVGALVRALVARRLGAGPASGAVLTLPRWEVSSMQLPLLDHGSWEYWTWTERLDALATDLAARVGDGPLVSGLERFLSRPTGGGTMEELLEDLGRASGTSLAGFYRDYCKGGALPEMTLSGVRMERRASGWAVTGRVENRGTGEAVCAVVLETDLDRVEIAVKVDGTGSAPFILETSHQPQTVQLDPGQTCHRYRPLAPGAVVEYVGLGTHG